MIVFDHLMAHDSTVLSNELNWRNTDWAKEVGPKLGDLNWKEDFDRVGEGEQGAVRGGSEHAGGSQGRHEAEGA